MELTDIKLRSTGYWYVYVLGVSCVNVHYSSYKAKKSKELAKGNNVEVVHTNLDTRKRADNRIFTKTTRFQDSRFCAEILFP